MGWITLLCIFAAGGWVAPLAAADQGFRLVDRDSGKSVQGVTVRLIHAGSSREWERETDEAGRARLVGVPTGQYRLQVEKPGYVDPGDIEGKGRWITVKENAGRELLILLERSVVVAGQVSTDDGRPLSGMGVFAARVLKADGRTRLQRIGALAFSDDQGRYRLHHLPAGSYVIVASPMGDVASGRGLGLVYYPGHRDVARAEVLELMPGAELPSADIRLQPGQQSSVTGTVTGIPRDWAGARAAVALVPQSGMRLPVALGMTDSAGRYELDGVPEGDYQVLAWGPSANLNFDEPPQGPSARYGSSAVEVRGGETPAVDLALLPGLRVEVQWPTGEACAGVESLRMRMESGWPEWWGFEGRSGGNGISWDGCRPAPTTLICRHWRVPVALLAFGQLRPGRRRNAFPLNPRQFWHP